MYQNRYLMVLEYIDLHLDDDLSADKLGSVANLSKFHLHRQFSACMGISLAAYVKRLRLKRAAYQLVYRSQMKVVDIALASGFESAEAFSRAFKLGIGQSPSDFRKAPEWISWLEKLTLPDKLRAFRLQNSSNKIEINTMHFEQVAVAVLEHRGPPELLGKSIRKFIEWRKLVKLSPNNSRTFNLLYDDPKLTSPENYRFDLCAEVKAAVATNDYGVAEKIIPAGKCAVYRHVGSEAGLEAAIDAMYSEWTAESRRELRDFPIFLERINFFPDVAEHEWVTDIYLPLL